MAAAGLSPGRPEQLRALAATAVSQAVDGYSAQEFTRAFGLPADHSPLLAHLYQQAVDALRANTQDEADLIFRQHHVDDSLLRLDAKIADVQLLANSIPSPATQQLEADALAARSARQQQEQALRLALKQVNQENAVLQEEYNDEVAALQEISARVSAWAEQLNQTAAACEQFPQARI